MSIAEANQVVVRFARETTWGETPSSPSCTELRMTSEQLQHNKNTVVSNEIRSDRQRTALLEVGKDASGPFGFELSYGSYESFMEAALRGTITSSKVTVQSSGITFAASSITRSSGNWHAAFTAGQFIRLKCAGSNNNKIVQIASLTSTVLTTTSSALTSGVVASATFIGRTIKNGTTKYSYFIEAQFRNITGVKYFTGMRPNRAALETVAQQIVTGTFEFMGKRGYTASASVAGTTSSANTNVPLTSAVNVAHVYEGGSKLGVAVQSFSLDINNNMRMRPQVGSQTGAEPADGVLDVTGRLNAFFENISLYKKLIDHTATSLAMFFRDTSGNVVVISMPNVYYATGGNPAAGGSDQDVFIDLPFQAIRDATKGYTIRVDMLPTQA